MKVVAGKLLRNTEFIGKMDPFLSFEFNGISYKTRVQHEAG